MKLIPSLSFNGQCRAAFDFYRQCLGAQSRDFMTWGESPMANEISPDLHDKVMHTSLSVGDFELMGSDSSPDHYQKPKGLSVVITTDDVVKAEHIFQALAENGQIQMPMQETFWAARFGTLIDQFDIPWMVNCDKAVE